MSNISVLIHAYLFVQIYEILSEDRKCYVKYGVVLAIAVLRRTVESVSYTRNIAPFILCTVLVLYSICIHSRNSNLENLKYALVVYGIDYVLGIVLGSVSGAIVAATEIENNDLKFLILSVGRILMLLLLGKCKKQVQKIRQKQILSIGVTGTIIALFAEQAVRVAYATERLGYVYIAVACTYLTALFTVLWLLDHYKMAKLQKLYADDNRQMSQKLHRSKEILPMIANYVSNMDGTQDERMREKLKEVCHDYGKELGRTEMSSEFFETTGIDLVDLLLRTKIIECEEEDIDLDVFVSAQIAKDMERLDMGDGEVMRLLGDLLRNGMNAVRGLREKALLLLIARDQDGCVLIKLYDSGIPFPPYILENFGERGNTTWGTGNGLADLMETLNRVNASIEINMDMKPEDVYTKGIYICFDGKNTVNVVKKTKVSEIENSRETDGERNSM